jgi:hypothetical protein
MGSEMISMPSSSRAPREIEQFERDNGIEKARKMERAEVITRTG